MTMTTSPLRQTTMKTLAAHMRRLIGMACFAGMIGATMIGCSGSETSPGAEAEHPGVGSALLHRVSDGEAAAERQMPDNTMRVIADNMSYGGRTGVVRIERMFGGEPGHYDTRYFQYQQNGDLSEAVTISGGHFDGKDTIVWVTHPAKSWQSSDLRLLFNSVNGPARDTMANNHI